MSCARDRRKAVNYSSHNNQASRVVVFMILRVLRILRILRIY